MSSSAPKKRWPIVVILLAICVVIAIIPLATLSDTEFGGADGQAEDLITEIDPDYEPWASSIIELPGGETESLLFCLQAAIGGIILGYGFGYYRARYKTTKEQSGDAAKLESSNTETA